MAQWRTFLVRFGSQIWSRLLIYTVVAVLLVVAAWWLGPYLPEWAMVRFGQDSVQTILQILASSMLAVTTFSLTAMISAYSSAASGTTPRATQLLIEDRTSQNALSSFLGSFVFAIVGIIALASGAVTDAGKSVLFLGTLGVVAVVVVTLLRWINHLTGFGRVADVIDRVESAATETACAYAERPHLGGAPPVAVPPGARVVLAEDSGYVTSIAMEYLADCAEGHDVTVHLAVLPGAAVGVGEALAYVTGTDDIDGEVRAAVLVESHRTYEQDPRLGLVALSEIGSRALSAAVNDPGTAIDVLGALQRVLTRVLQVEPDGSVDYPGIHVPGVAFADLIDDAFRPIARDGAGAVEVALRVQKTLAALTGIADGDAAAELRSASARAADRALRALDDDGDRLLVEKAAAAIQEA